MGTNWQMFLLPCHGQRGQGKGSIIECQLEGDMYGIEKYLLTHQLNMHLLVIEITGNFTYLTHGVVDETTSFRTIVQGETLFRFIFTNE